MPIEGCVEDSDSIALDFVGTDEASLQASVRISTRQQNGVVSTSSGIWAPSRPPVVSALPSSPRDGDEVLYQTVQTGIYWHLIFVEAVGLWVPDGEQPPLTSYVDTSEPRTTASYLDLATPGPQVNAPLAGDYLVTWGASIGTSADGNIARYGVAFGVTAAVDSFAVATGNGNLTSLARSRVKAGIPADALVKLQAKGDGAGVSNFSNRWLELRPQAISA